MFKKKGPPAGVGGWPGEFRGRIFDRGSAGEASRFAANRQGREVGEPPEGWQAGIETLGGKGFDQRPGSLHCVDQVVSD